MRKQGKRFWGDLFKSIALVGGIASVLVAINWGQMGRSDTERFITDLVMPFTFFWIALGWLTLWRYLRQQVEVTPVETVPEGGGISPNSLRRDSLHKGQAKLPPTNGNAITGGRTPIGEWKWLAFVWLFLTVIGNGWVADAAIRATEYPTDLEWMEGDSFDFVVLLGGGVSAGVADSPVLNSDGDRVRPPLALWGTGRAEKLVVTGSAGIEGRPGGAELTEQLFRSFGVPPAALVQTLGRNTSEEMVALRAYVDAWRSDHEGKEPRWALVTSAFHMPRALRLAKKEELSPIPITTASRLSYEPVRWARVLIPSSGAMDNLARCFKEKLAALVGR